MRETGMRMGKAGTALLVGVLCSIGIAHGQQLTPASGATSTSATTAFGDCAGGEIYDDGAAEFGFGASTVFTSFQAVQLFTPATNPGSYSTVCLGLSLGSQPIGPGLDFQIQVWDDNGPGGEPGTLLGSLAVSEPDLTSTPPCTFRAYDISSLGLSIPGGSVWIGVEWNPAAFPSTFMCADATLSTPQHPALRNHNDGSGWVPAHGQARAILVRGSPDAFADLAMAKDGEVAGTQITYSLTVTNNGPAEATGVVVTDPLPPELTFVSDDCGGVEGPPWSWSLNPLAAGASATCTLLTAVDPLYLGDISNTATVAGAELDQNPGNNSDTVRLVAGGPSVLEIPALGDISRVFLVLLVAGSAVLILRRFAG